MKDETKMKTLEIDVASDDACSVLPLDYIGETTTKCYRGTEEEAIHLLGECGW